MILYCYEFGTRLAEKYFDLKTNEYNHVGTRRLKINMPSMASMCTFIRCRSREPARQIQCVAA